MAGARHNAPLHKRDGLASGQIVHGPALIIDPTSTVAVEPGWSAELLADGTLRLSREAPRGPRRGGYWRRSGPARDFRRTVHGRGRGNGLGAAAQCRVGQHPRAARLLLRGVRRWRTVDRQRAAYSSASRLDGRVRQKLDCQPRDASGRCLRAQRSVQGRNASARCDGGAAGVRAAATRRLSSSRRAGTMPTSAASPPARCLPTAARSWTRASSSMTASSRAANFSKPNCAQSWAAARIPSAQHRSEYRRYLGAARRLRAGRDRAAETGRRAGGGRRHRLHGACAGSRRALGSATYPRTGGRRFRL